MFPERKPQSSAPGRRLAAIFLALACLAAGPALAEPGHVVVVEADSSILEPPSPVPFSGRRLRFYPIAEGGYATAVSPAPPIEPRGKLFRWAARDNAPVRVELVRPVAVFGELHREIWVYPHGAVSLGTPFADGVRASAASAGRLAPDLLSGPAVVAPLWNELTAHRPLPGGGVFVAQVDGTTAVSWIGIPSVRPADAPNTFRVTFREDGVIDLDYGPLSTGWGVVAIAPQAELRGSARAVDFARTPEVPAATAAIAHYRDLPTLNELALARRVYEQIPDRFEFLTVFSTAPIGGPHLVYSSTVKNTDAGIGLPLFDQSALFGAQRLEHLIVMNDLALWSDDPAAPPRSDGYAFAESTLDVLAHEAGHRWLSHLDGELCSGDGHWSYFLESGASLMGGHRLLENPDGSFTSVGAMDAFAPLDLYLMGLLPAEEVTPFFVVDSPHDFSGEAGAPVPPPGPGSRPEVGITFRGERRDRSIHDLVAELGPRSPAPSSQRSFGMAFVLLVPPGGAAGPAEIAKVERIRRAFGPYFRRATQGRARMWTRVPVRDRSPGSVEADALLVAGVPRVLGTRAQETSDGRALLEIDFADYHGDLALLEVSTDATEDVPPARLAVDAENQGARRGTLRLVLRDLPAEARELRVSLHDALGQRSPVYAWRLAP